MHSFEGAVIKTVITPTTTTTVNYILFYITNITFYLFKDI